MRRKSRLSIQIFGAEGYWDRIPQLSVAVGGPWQGQGDAERVSRPTSPQCLVLPRQLAITSGDGGGEL